MYLHDLLDEYETKDANDSIITKAMEALTSNKSIYGQFSSSAIDTLVFPRIENWPHLKSFIRFDATFRADTCFELTDRSGGVVKRFFDAQPRAHATGPIARLPLTLESARKIYFEVSDHAKCRIDLALTRYPEFVARAERQSMLEVVVTTLACDDSHDELLLHVIWPAICFVQKRPETCDCWPQRRTSRRYGSSK